MGAGLSAIGVVELEDAVIGRNRELFEFRELKFADDSVRLISIGIQHQRRLLTFKQRDQGEALWMTHRFEAFR